MCGTVTAAQREAWMAAASGLESSIPSLKRSSAGDCGSPLAAVEVTALMARTFSLTPKFTKPPVVRRWASDSPSIDGGCSNLASTSTAGYIQTKLAVPLGTRASTRLSPRRVGVAAGDNLTSNVRPAISRTPHWLCISPSAKVRSGPLSRSTARGTGLTYIGARASGKSSGPAQTWFAKRARRKDQSPERSMFEKYLNCGTSVPVSMCAKKSERGHSTATERSTAPMLSINKSSGMALPVRSALDLTRCLMIASGAVTWKMAMR
mmetsp:Transcript_51580/g.131189  ORF Transcript_51580/g.131189 Transcript_51580/m.131189 type:complete len:264 (-) Transcript_51580:855-1646(-)